MLEIGTMLSGRYEVLKRVGSGGMADVYMAKDHKLNRNVAVKVLKSEYVEDEKFLKKFETEAQAVARLSHPNIVNVYDVGIEDGINYIVMELAEGMTLKEYIRRKGYLSPKETVEISLQIASAISHAHKNHIIHRDISANNIFIISGMLKIADFGLGKDLNIFTSHQTIHTNSMGQYYYCAPEQFMMLKDGDKRSDVYSLGRVINFIMTGDPRNAQHAFRNVAEKSTNSDSAYRYADAGQLLNFFNKAVEYKNNLDNKERIEEKIRSKQFDDEIEGYIYNLTGEEIARKMQSYRNGFSLALMHFMKIDESHAEYVIQSIDKAYQTVCGRSYEAYDVYSSFAYDVLKEKFSFVV